MKYLLNWFKRRYYRNVHVSCGNEMWALLPLASAARLPAPTQP